VNEEHVRRVVDAYVAAWNEPDAGRRRRLLDQVMADGGDYVDPAKHLPGPAAIDEYIATALRRDPDRRIVRTSEVDAHHRVCRFAWQLVDADGTPGPENVDFVEFTEDGRIRQVTGFFGPLVPSDRPRRNVSSGGPFEDVFGYSRAVRVGGHVHVSGTTSRPPHLDGADAYEQAVTALSIVAQALRDAGSSMAAVVRTVTYVTDMADLELVARAHREAFADVRPAATLVQVSQLVDPRMKVEIEAYAVEPG
jgi:enamine deaminase RidA (YjgF/YER057c/UK114 family)